MRVKAAPGHRVPTEEDPYKYIEETKAVDVPDTSYYRRRVTTGELLTAENSRASAKQPAQESAE
ncbi:hypothetical protein [Pseudomonas veronii]|jgi:hypothetical protein|uniref:hypothetical protein n=1 Tax=Pseudomonas veronii TaxID=76761 RepID=UPI0005C585E6|nr:hypothetical protein [Pseudomonas veronii]RTY72309.1 hypothetical protein EKA83_24360 [Pseudomonas veronii]